jgi:hypothetical protein
MNKSSTFGCLWIALVSLAVMGCVGGPPDEDIASAQEAALISNALISNALISNALISNALISNALISNALTTQSLTTNPLTSTAWADPNAREVLQYVASCALPADQSVSVSSGGTTYTYPGGLGLAPAWGQPNGRCDQACQEWVSGCLIARLDYEGEAREISVRGANPALDTPVAERVTYPKYEATYYGNVFESPQEIYGCLLPGQSSDTRVCGPSLGGCVVKFTGDCLANCDFPLADGAFPGCRNKPWWDPTATPYVGSVTVFLQPGEP